MTSATNMVVNGRDVTVQADGDTPLIYVLRNDLGLKGVRFGCGLGLCGSCCVLIDGRSMYSCDMPLWAAAGKQVVTVEGLGTADAPSAVQKAFLDEQAMQCGYCVSGVIVSATELLRRNPAPSDDEIRGALDKHLCRCAAYGRMLRAVRRAAASLGGSAGSERGGEAARAA